MQSIKTELRRQLRQTRLGMGDGERVLKSREIIKRLRTLIDWSAVSSLHYFEPIHELLEVDILDFITELEDKYPDTRMCTSRLIGDTWELISVRDTSVPDSFDVIIVPMLGFDSESLHRIGYGGGYYDKFLATQPQSKKIGVCFENGNIVDLPASANDAPLDIIITEKTSYN